VVSGSSSISRTCEKLRRALVRWQPDSLRNDPKSSGGREKSWKLPGEITLPELQKCLWRTFQPLPRASVSESHGIGYRIFIRLL
jgi:hypothetical protein